MRGDIVTTTSIWAEVDICILLFSIDFDEAINGGVGFAYALTRRCDTKP